MIGLKPSDYVDAVSKPPFQNPMKIILKDFFHEVANIEYDETGATAEQLASVIRKNDVICFYSAEGQQSEFIHTARISHVGPETLLLSKMGRRGPVMLTNMKFLMRHYPQTKFVKVYRFRPSNKSGDST